MKFINLTHRAIIIVDEHEHELLVLKPSGIIVGSTVETVVAEEYRTDGGVVPCVNYTYKDVSGLPDPAPDTRYVVSYAVLQALNGTRTDVISPDTSPGSILRQGPGQKVLGVRRFRKL